MLVGRWLSEGLLGRGGGSFLSLLASLLNSVFVPLKLSFWRRSRKASIPSLGSEADGTGGGGMLFVLNPALGLDGSPTLRLEYADARDIVEDTDAVR
jgi:hypothetical protein